MRKRRQRQEEDAEEVLSPLLHPFLQGWQEELLMEAVD